MQNARDRNSGGGLEIRFKLASRRGAFKDLAARAVKYAWTIIEHTQWP